ncbi:MAG: M20/M25/M40 family metallo-hydrolase [Thermomicrobiales bacterium]|nr:M20/M25/M40 family metallo-hydrolase [Thermomicrobiales bacterium]
MPDLAILRSRVRELMDEVTGDLSHLVAIPSCAFPGYPSEPILEAANAVVNLLKRSGVDNAHLIEIPDGYPSVYGEVQGPEGAPVVLMYGHYDVQPAPMEQGWNSDPFQPELRDGRLYGRGAADDKSGLVQNAASVRVFQGDLPVTVKFLIEGEEETKSHLGPFVTANPEIVACDVFVITDLGNTRAGEPVITVSERGDVACNVEVRTLAGAVHSGKFGGAVPDALMALIRILATLQNDAGETVVPGTTRFEWEGADFPEELYREATGLLPGVDLIGRGSLSTRLWSSPSVTVLGMDVPTVADGGNVLQPSAKARLSMRIVPGSDEDAELEALMQHLEAAAPWGVQVTVEKVKAGPPFQVPKGGPAITAARAAMTEAFGAPCEFIGSGASIPLLNTLEAAAPGAEFILWGAQDVEFAKIHGANESVDLAELERCIVAQAHFLQLLGDSTV